MHHHKFIFFLLFTITALGAGRSAWAEDDETARTAFMNGNQLYKEGKYEEAIKEFQKADAIKPSPVLDYNIGRCHEQLGQFVEAKDAYEKYLAARPYAQNREQILQKIDTLKEKISRQEQSSSEESPTTQPATQPTTQPSSRPAFPTASQQTSTGNMQKPVHEAMLPSSWKMTDVKPNPPERQPMPRHPPEEGPIYKQWWFWVAAVAGVVITGFIIGTAVAEDNPGPPSNSTFQVPAQVTGPSGMQFRF